MPGLLGLGADVHRLATENRVIGTWTFGLNASVHRVQRAIMADMAITYHDKKHPLVQALFAEYIYIYIYIYI